MAWPDPAVWIGRLILYDDDSIRLRSDTAGVISLKLELIERLEASRGPNPILVLGGPALGAGVGAFVGPALMRESIECEAGATPDDRCGSLTAEPVIGAAVGAVFLGLVSSLLARERWAVVDLAVSPPESGGSPRLELGIALSP